MNDLRDVFFGILVIAVFLFGISLLAVFGAWGAQSVFDFFARTM